MGKTPSTILPLSETSEDDWAWLRGEFCAPGDLQLKVMRRRRYLSNLGREWPCYLALDNSVFPDDLKGWRTPQSAEVAKFENKIREACLSFEYDRFDPELIMKSDLSALRKLTTIAIVGGLVIVVTLVALVAWKIRQHELGYSWIYSGPCWNYLFNIPC